jgi:hypothetical protein
MKSSAIFLNIDRGTAMKAYLLLRGAAGAVASLFLLLAYTSIADAAAPQLR